MKKTVCCRWVKILRIKGVRGRQRRWWTSTASLSLLKSGDDNEAGRKVKDEVGAGRRRWETEEEREIREHVFNQYTAGWRKVVMVTMASETKNEEDETSSAACKRKSARLKRTTTTTTGRTKRDWVREKERERDNDDAGDRSSGRPKQIASTEKRRQQQMWIIGRWVKRWSTWLNRDRAVWVKERTG